MSRSRRFLGGLGFGYLNQAAVMLTGMWLTRFFLRHIGQHDYGLWLAGTQLLTYLMLMDFGIVALLPREVAYATGREQGEALDRDLRRIIGESARVVLLQTPVVALAALILWFTIPPAWAPLRMPLLWVMAVFILFFPLRVFVATLEGLQDLAFIGGLQFTAWAANVLVTTLLVASGWRLEALAVGWMAIQCITATAAFLRVKRRFPGALPHALPKLERPKIVEFFRRGFWLSVAQIAQSLLAGTDLLIVTAVVGPAAAVVYSCTAKLVMVLSNQPQILMNASAPAVSQLRASGDYPRLLVVSICLTRIMMAASGLVAVVVLAVNERFVSWWVGPGRYGGFVLTAALVAAMLLRHLNHTTVASLICYGKERRISLTTFSDGIVTLAASFVAIKLWGLTGGAVGSLAGALLVSVPVNFQGLAHEMRVPARAILAPLAPWFWRFALAAGLALAVRNSGLLATLPGFFACSAGIGIVYAGLVLPLFFREPLAQYTRPLVERFRLTLLPAGVR